MEKIFVKNSDETLEMKTANFNKFELAGIKEQGDFFVLEGYGSTFDDVDLGDDCVVAGAFKDSLLKRMPKMLWQHDRYQPIGVWTEIHEDGKGLRVSGKLPKNNTNSRNAAELIKCGALGGLSIGYSVPADGWDVRDGVRYLKKLELHEISIVTFPMNPKAEINSCKAAVPFQDLPLADKEHAWDGAAAEARVRKFAGAEDEPNEKYRKAFLWYDAENAKLFTAYKLPIADVVDGKLTAIPRAIFAAAAALKGARGGVKIPDADKEKAKAHLEKYYKKLDMENPFEKGLTICEVEDMKGLNEYLKQLGMSNAERGDFVVKVKQIFNAHETTGDGEAPELEAGTKQVDVQPELVAEMKSLADKLAKLYKTGA